MRRRCETCKYFKYVESNVYGRCQNKTEESVLDGIQIIPWATDCEFFQDRRMPDKNDLDEGVQNGYGYYSKTGKNSSQCTCSLCHSLEIGPNQPIKVPLLYIEKC